MEKILIAEGFGAVLYKQSGLYRIFRVTPSHSGINFPVVDVKRGRNAEMLGVEGLITCGSVFYENERVLCWTHAVNPGNLRELLREVRNHFNERGYSVLISPRIKEYLPVARQMLKGSRLVILKGNRFSMRV